MMTTHEISSVSLKGALIDGQPIDWAVLIAAATQDRASQERDHRGCPVPPNDAHELPESYREILRAALPLVQAAAKAAYDDYCQHGVTTRQPSGVHAIGHGSWVSGPDGTRQATYTAWENLATRLVAVTV